jgi:hypothetical protein
MKNLLQSIEAGNSHLTEGLIFVIIATIVVFAISYILPEIKKVK